MVPLSDPRASGLKAVRTNPAAKAIADPGDWYFGMHGDSQQKEYMSETDTLKATRLAFILAKKSNIGLNRPNGHHEGNTANDDDARNFSYAINSSIAPTLPGTQKLQKLCSFEYLQRYIDAMANRPGPGGLVHLSTKGNNPLFNNVAGAPRGPAGQGPLSDGSITDWAGNSNYPGVLGETLAEGLSRGRKRKAALDAVPAVGAAGGPDDTNGGAIKTAQGNIQPAAADVSVSNCAAATRRCCSRTALRCRTCTTWAAPGRWTMRRRPTARSPKSRQSTGTSWRSAGCRRLTPRSATSATSDGRAAPSGRRRC